MPKTPQQYLKAPYARVLIPEDHGGFFAEILEFPGCFAEGATADEALQRLNAAAEAWIAAALEQGQEIPEPSSNVGHSGKLALRLPRSLHRQAVRMAQRDGTSLNQFLVTAIAARVGAEDLFVRLVERMRSPFVSFQVVHNTANIYSVSIGRRAANVGLAEARASTAPNPILTPAVLLKVGL